MIGHSGPDPLADYVETEWWEWSGGFRFHRYYLSVGFRLYPYELVIDLLFWSVTVGWEKVIRYHPR